MFGRNKKQMLDQYRNDIESMQWSYSYLSGDASDLLFSLCTLRSLEDDFAVHADNEDMHQIILAKRQKSFAENIALAKSALQSLEKFETFEKANNYPESNFTKELRKYISFSIKLLIKANCVTTSIGHASHSEAKEAFKECAEKFSAMFKGLSIICGAYEAIEKRNIFSSPITPMLQEQKRLYGKLELFIVQMNNNYPQKNHTLTPEN